MASRPVYLLIDGRTSKARGHFATFIPNASDINQTPSQNQPCTGTVIHVVGNPMIGFHHEFKRNYNTASSTSFRSLAPAILLGSVQQSLHADPPSSTTNFSTDTSALGALDVAALQVPCPAKSDVRAPVDGVCACLLLLWTIITYPCCPGLANMSSGS